MLLPCGKGRKEIPSQAHDVYLETEMDYSSVQAFFRVTLLALPL